MGKYATLQQQQDLIFRADYDGIYNVQEIN